MKKCQKGRLSKLIKNTSNWHAKWMRWLGKFNKNISLSSKIWFKHLINWKLLASKISQSTKKTEKTNIEGNAWFIKILQKTSRIQQRINNFDINLTIHPEIKEQILTLTGTILDILEGTNEDKPYLRELLHHLLVTYNIITITNEDYMKIETSVTSSE